MRQSILFNHLSMCALLVGLACAPAWAMDATDLLPASVNSPAVRYGVVSGVDSKYLSNGTVASLNDINTIHFDSAQLVKISPEAKKLVDILDQFSQQRLGSQLNLGTLRVETLPDVRYLAPIYARGITDNVSLAVAAPIVFYKNKLRIAQSASNVKGICDQVRGLQEPVLNDACDQLEGTRISEAVSGELAKKGYKAIKDREETVFGDLQLVGLWKFFQGDAHSAMVRTSLNLPTGPGNDPDDLADLGVFGTTSIEPLLVYNWLPWSPLRLAAKVGYKYMVPDSHIMRVPMDEDDVLPGVDAKENVSRKLGDSLSVGAAATLTIFDSLSFAGGYEIVRKSSDRFSGATNRRYDLLAKNSNSVAYRLRGGVGYDTIGLYKRTQKVPPLKVDFEVTNTIAGKNTDRQLVNEVSLTMFF